MHFNNEGIGSNRNRGARDGADQALLAGSMGGIGHYREVREFFGEGDGG
jgi:hypothetical protein